MLGLSYCAKAGPLDPTVAIPLERQGLVRHRPGSDLMQPTEDLRFCLLLEDPPSIRARPHARH